MNTYLELQQVAIAYQHNTIVQDFSLSLAQGQLGCLLGPSGCGKTTLLRAIAGFEPLTQGQIKLQDTVLSKPTYTQAPEQRQIGVVFQDYALFPHLSVAQNIAFGIRQQSKAQQQARVQALLDLVSLPAFAKRYPHELSGGQQQRIALARALAPNPRLLLLDEPFASQDISLRESLAQEVRAILKQTQTTALLVTHDQHEAFAMADEIGVMQAGRLQQWDSAYNLYHHPANAFVAGFIGQGTLIHGQVLETQQVQTALGLLPLPASLPLAHGTTVQVLIRPEQIHSITPDHRTTPAACIVAKVFRGAETLYTLRLPDQQLLLALLPSQHDLAVGENVQFVVDDHAPILFKTDTTLDIPHT